MKNSAVVCMRLSRGRRHTPPSESSFIPNTGPNPPPQSRMLSSLVSLGAIREDSNPGQEQTLEDLLQRTMST